MRKLTSQLQPYNSSKTSLSIGVGRRGRRALKLQPMESWGQPWTSAVCSVAETHWWVVSLYRCMQHVIAAEEMGNSDSVIPILGNCWTSNYGSLLTCILATYCTEFTTCPVPLQSCIIAVSSHCLREWLVQCHSTRQTGAFS